MFVIRKIAKTLRGQAKPYQIVSAAVLGTLIGFAPPFASAPLYLVGVVLLLAVLNANFFIATFTAGVAKLLALALMPISFELGLRLVDGPLQPIFAGLVNAPVTALMGFEYYVTTGGTVVAIALGTLIGLGYLKLISNFRKKMAKVEADSEKYADFVSKRGVRIVMWVLFGGKAKVTYAELAEQKKIGNPIRPLGVVFAVLVVGLLLLVQQFFSGQIVTTLLKGHLEEVHGATVDLQGVTIDLARGEIVIDRLAMADPDNLATDLIRANQVKGKISTGDLLRKRITIDSIVIDDAVQGQTRERPGVLIGKRPEPSEPQEGKTLEEWFDKAQVWRERLATARHWLEKLRGPADEEDASGDQERDRLREWADLYGRAEVRADHLIEQTPTVLVRRGEINKLRGQWPEDETLDVRFTNLSTHPEYAPEKPRITVVSSGKTFDLDLTIAPRALPDQQSAMKFTLRNQSIDGTLDDLNIGKGMGFVGGTWLAGTDGNWSDLDGLNLPFTLVLENTTATIAGTQQPVERFPITFNINGSLDNPGIDIDAKQLAQTASNTFGKAMLNQFLGDAIGSGIGKQITDTVGGFLGQDNADNPDGEDQDADQTDIKDKLREGIGGFLNRDNEDE